MIGKEMKMTTYVTNAPDNYDYPGVKTLGKARHSQIPTGNLGRGDWRRISIDESVLSPAVMAGRYSSGLYQMWHLCEVCGEPELPHTHAACRE